MILDKEEHKAMLLELIKMATFPGEFLDSMYELKQSVQNAGVVEDNMENKNEHSN